LNVYFFAEHDEIEDIADAIYKELGVWAEPKTTVTTVLRNDETDEQPKTKRETEVGYEISISKTQKLKDPLNFLNTVAKSHKCDFVVGMLEDDKYQDVCYFGNEEGRPDMFEIAHYLGLES
jgi:hypothetical protein